MPFSRMVDDLHRLVNFASDQPKPLLLVGVDYSTFVARFYTQLYEQSVNYIPVHHIDINLLRHPVSVLYSLVQAFSTLREMYLRCEAEGLGTKLSVLLHVACCLFFYK